MAQPRPLLNGGKAALDGAAVFVVGGIKLWCTTVGRSLTLAVMNIGSRGGRGFVRWGPGGGVGGGR